jgi:hypothetical protein
MKDKRLKSEIAQPSQVTPLPMGELITCGEGGPPSPRWVNRILPAPCLLNWFWFCFQKTGSATSYRSALFTLQQPFSQGTDCYCHSIPCNCLSFRIS